MQHWIKLALLCWALCGPANLLAAEPAPLRIGLSSVLLEDQTAFVHAWQHYLQNRLKRPVSFVQRANYREIVTLLQNGKLDSAWLCSYPYITNTKDLRLLAVPVYKGEPVYQSYLIVPAADRKTSSIADLKGKLFAFSDPDSNSGYLVPLYQLSLLKQQPNSFFGKAFFTWSHSKVVEAVASELAHGGAVDGYIWDSLVLLRPELTAQTRIVWKSQDFGFPPFVVRKGLAKADADALRSALLAMQNEEEGRKLLALLNLDGFVPGNDKMFDSVAYMVRKLGD